MTKFEYRIKPECKDERPVRVSDFVIQSSLASAAPVGQRVLRNSGLAAAVLFVVMLAGAASAVSPATRLKSNYLLALKAERLTEAVVGNRSRDVYRMFTPAFAAEHSYARFDSALSRWYRGRRIVRASHKVVEVKGPAGYVSSWFVFEGERDYNYVYQNWLNSPHGWELVWLSRVLDPSFSFGQTDSLELVRAAEAGLRYALSKPGLDRFRAGFRRPDTLVMLRLGQPGEGEFRLASAAPVGQSDSIPVFWTTVEDMKQGRPVPKAQFVVSLALVRIMDDIALVTVDLTPVGRDASGRKRRPRGIEVYLQRAGAEWRFYDVGKKW